MSSPSDLPAAALCLGMALVFGQSAWHALRDVPTHVEMLRAYRLVPARTAAPAAGGVALLNVLAALMLVAPALRRAGAVLGVALLVLYAGAMAINLRRGHTDIECGCGGADRQRISAGLVARNLLLASALAAASFAGPDVPGDAVSRVMLPLAALCVAALYFAASQLLANRATFA